MPDAAALDYDPKGAFDHVQMYHTAGQIKLFSVITVMNDRVQRE
jgi:hypothetical protein